MGEWADRLSENAKMLSTFSQFASCETLWSLRTETKNMLLFGGGQQHQLLVLLLLLSSLTSTLGVNWSATCFKSSMDFDARHTLKEITCRVLSTAPVTD